MSTPENGGSAGPTPKLQLGVATGLLAAFAALVVFMLTSVDSEATAWERQVYIFGAVEAIVFTAVGWIFGREVHRAGAERAQEDADTAKAQVAEKQEEVVALTKEAQKGHALKAAVSSTVVSAAPPGGFRGVEVGEEQPAAAATSATASLASLRTFAETLYEDPE